MEHEAYTICLSQNGKEWGDNKFSFCLLNYFLELLPVTSEM